MSLGARVVIALFAALFGVLMAAVAPPTEKAPLFYAFAAFCVSIAVACVARGRIAQVFGSLVATGILVAGLLYFASMLFGGPMVTWWRSGQSLVNALLFLAVFGAPSAVYLWHARFGFGHKSGSAPLSGGGSNEA